MNFLPAIFVLAAGLLAVAGSDLAPARQIVGQFCVDCHDSGAAKGGLNLESIVQDPAPEHAETWEKVVRKVRARQMPPPGKKRPKEAEFESALRELTRELDAAAIKHPNPGRTETFRRLNRTEYRNAIRDLLALEVDTAALLPKDDASHGFDNVTVAGLSPTLLDRYLSAAQKIARLAVGRTAGDEAVFIRLPADLTQEGHMPGLPLGTRGGAVIRHTYPVSGEYEVGVRLARDRNEEIEGLHEDHEMVVLLDRREAARFTISPPRGHRNFELVDQHLKVSLPVAAGPHELAVAFLKKGSSLHETKRQPYAARFNMHRHPRSAPAVYQVAIQGPRKAEPAKDTPTRRRIFGSALAGAEGTEDRAREILSRLMRQAYRRPITGEDVERAIAFYREGAKGGGFESGIETALAAILSSPEFLFRIELEPEEAPAGSPYRVSDIALASRLSFFIWSSIPDERLLAAAEKGTLSDPKGLKAEVQRMLADPRAKALAENFAGQWLYLRNLDTFTPDLRLFPDFDQNLRTALRRETEMFFESVVQHDGNVLELLRAEHTFLNERLARHYGISGVMGSRFRRVEISDEHRRGGLLRHGSILAVTSYATRTSPVIRGDWVLKNILGTPTPPPPADVPALKENTVSSSLSTRERLAEHRANPACASCHDAMDPVGFALENFDASGRWRILEEGKFVDASGGLPDGSTFEGVDGLEEALLKRPELFVGTLTEKLLTFALGRGVEYYDAPAVREIVRDAQAENYRFSSIITGIAKSRPFQMRTKL